MIRNKSTKEVTIKIYRYLFIFFLIISTWLKANIKYTEYLNQSDFPIEDRVLEQFSFWHDIFFKYPSTSFVIYDTNNPSLVLEVIDFKYLVTQGKWFYLPTPKEQKKYVRKRLKQYRESIKKIRDKKTSNFAGNTLEYKIFTIIQQFNENVEIEHINLRIQQGISDNFFQAAKESQKYMDIIEGIMKRLNLPLVLSRIPFVESRFNNTVRSKYGASGMWQFMPKTAKQYLIINEMLDERNCFIKSSLAAAKLLRSYHQKLASWPLAITSYNHGITGIYKISKYLNTKDFNHILKSYDSPRFKYASQNFYAEVMAAAVSYQKLLDHNLLKRTSKKNQISMVLLKKRLSLKDLITKYLISKKELQEYNLSFNKRAFTSYFERPLPYDFRLILSTKTAQKVSKYHYIKPVMI